MEDSDISSRKESCVMDENGIIIDNCIVTKFMENGVKIEPINQATKMNPKLNINSLRRITCGSRVKDNHLLLQLSTGKLKYEYLIQNKFK